MTYSLPPHYVLLPVDILKQACKPDKPHEGLFLTFVQLLSLAWDDQYKQTPRLLEEEMYNRKNSDGSVRYGYLKIGRREYFMRKREMELLGWLRSTHPVTGFVQFTFDSAITDAAESSAQISTLVHVRALDDGGGGESLNLTLNPDSAIPPLKEEASAQTCTFPNVLEILRHTELIFGQGNLVMSRDLADREPLSVLAWCAYAYKSGIKGAAGIVRNRLMENEPPPEWAKQQWQETLPCDFLEAIGVAEYTCEICQATFKKVADLHAHQSTHPRRFECIYCQQAFDEEINLDSHLAEEHGPAPMPVDESAHQPISDGTHMTPARAWESVLGQLQLDIPRAAFDTWVRDTRAIRYDGSGSTLTIGVRNAYARDWLESRLASTVRRLLVGILDADVVDVAFVVSDFEEVDP